MSEAKEISASLMKLAEELDKLAEKSESQARVKTGAKADSNSSYGDYGSFGVNRGYGLDPLTAFCLDEN